MQNDPELRLLQLLDAHDHGAQDTSDGDDIAASQHETDPSLGAEEHGLAALFDATAGVAAPDVLARLDAFARETAGAQLGARSDDAVAAGESDVAASLPTADAAEGNVVSIRPVTRARADVWPGRWLLALAASLLLTMGGLSWPTMSHDAIEDMHDVAVTHGARSGTTQASATAVALESDALALAIDDPLAGVGGVDWNGELDDDYLDLGDVSAGETALADAAFGDDLYLDSPL